MYAETVPLPTAVGPASTTRWLWWRDRPRAREVVAQPSALPDAEPADALLVGDVEVVDAPSQRASGRGPGRCAAVRARAGPPRRCRVGPGRSRATSERRSRGVATSCLTAARARRAATAARDAATRSTSGGSGRGLIDDASASSPDACVDAPREPVRAGREHGCATHAAIDVAAWRSRTDRRTSATAGALLAEAGGEHRDAAESSSVEPVVPRAHGRAEHDAERSERPPRIASLLTSRTIPRPRPCCRRRRRARRWRSGSRSASGFEVAASTNSPLPCARGAARSAPRASRRPGRRRPSSHPPRAASRA